jgi:transmembrane sensor
MDHTSKYEIPWELITDSFEGSLLPEDELKLSEWLSADPENRKKYTSLQELWKNGLEDYKFYQQADESSSWKKLAARMNNKEVSSADGVIKIKRNSLILTISGIAAGFLLLIAAGSLLFNRNSKHFYNTAAGEHKEITLKDGSDVSLKPETRITIARDFNESTRIVSMEKGEASFKVSHQDKPFIVKAGPVRIEDLGTIFIVRKDEEKIYVEVSSGEVAFIINSTDERKELSAGTSITFEIAKMKPGDIIDTQTGMISKKELLNFNNSPLSEVIVSVEKIYGIRIVITDTTTGEKRLTADLNGIPLENVISIICKSLNLEFTIKDSTYLLNEKGKK